MQTVEEYLRDGGSINNLEMGETGIDVITGVSKVRLERYGSRMGNRLKVWVKKSDAIIGIEERFNKED